MHSGAHAGLARVSGVTSAPSCSRLHAQRRFPQRGRNRVCCKVKGEGKVVGRERTEGGAVGLHSPQTQGRGCLHTQAEGRL